MRMMIAAMFESSQNKGKMTLWLVSVERSQSHGSLKKECIEPRLPVRYLKTAVMKCGVMGKLYVVVLSCINRI